MVDLGHVQVFVQVLDDDSLGVEQLSDNVWFGWIIRQPCRYKVWRDVFSPAKPDGFIDTLLHECQLSSVVNHDDALVGKVELFFARPVPVYF